MLICHTARLFFSNTETVQVYALDHLMTLYEKAVCPEQWKCGKLLQKESWEICGCKLFDNAALKSQIEALFANTYWRETMFF